MTETIDRAADSYAAGYAAALAEIAAELRHRIARDEARIAEHEGERAARLARPAERGTIDAWARKAAVRSFTNGIRDLRQKRDADMRALSLVVLAQKRTDRSLFRE